MPTIAGHSGANDQLLSLVAAAALGLGAADRTEASQRLHAGHLAGGARVPDGMALVIAFDGGGNHERFSPLLAII